MYSDVALFRLAVGGCVIKNYVSEYELGMYSYIRFRRSKKVNEEVFNLLIFRIFYYFFGCVR